MSYYRTIGGRRYDRTLLEQAETMTQGQGDGRLSQDDVRQLLDVARDGDSITEVERQTLHYILTEFQVTDTANAWLVGQLAALPSADAATTIERVLRKEFALTTLQVGIDPQEVIRQSELPGEVSFEIALRFALISFFEDEMAPETPRGLVIQVNQLSPETFADGQSYEQAVSDKVRGYLNDGGRFALLPFHADPDPDQIDYDLPEDGERVREHWIFSLHLPKLSDHTYWAIVHRNGQRPAYNYGFN
jgi:hypothetical protein